MATKQQSPFEKARAAQDIFRQPFSTSKPDADGFIPDKPATSTTQRPGPFKSNVKAPVDDGFVPDTNDGFVPDAIQNDGFVPDPIQNDDGFVPDAEPNFDGFIPDQKQTDEPSVASKIWSGAKDFGKAVVKDLTQSAYRAGIKNFTVEGNPLNPLSKFPGIPTLMQHTLYKKLPEKIETPLGEMDIKYSDNPIKATGQVLTDTINIGGLFYGGPAMTGTKVGLMQGLKTGGKQFGMNYAKKQAAVRGFDFSAGALFSVGENVAEGEDDLGTLTKEALVSGGVNVVATPLFGKGLKLLFKTTGKTLSLVDDVASTMVTKLDNFAAPKIDEAALLSKGVAEKSNLMEMANPNVFYKRTWQQGAAEKLSSAIGWVQEAPQKFVSTILDDGNPIRQFVKNVEGASGESVSPDIDPYKTYRLADSQAFEKVNDLFKDYTAIKTQNPELNEFVNAYMLAKDLSERAKHGPLPRGMTDEQVTGEWDYLKGLLTEDQALEVEKIAGDTQGFLDNFLKEEVKFGRITQESYAAMREQHPNYIPHNVLDYMAAEGGWNRTGGYNQNSPFKKAEGSEREIEGVDTAILRYITDHTRGMNRNRVPRQIIELAEKGGKPEELGFIPQRTAENVKKRNVLLKELSDYRQTLENLKVLQADAFKGDKNLSNKIFKTAEKLSKLEAEYKKAVDDLGGDLETEKLFFKQTDPATTLNDLTVSFQSKADLEADYGSLRKLLELADKNNMTVAQVLFRDGYHAASIKSIVNALESKEIPVNTSELKKYVVNLNDKDIARRQVMINNTKEDLGNLVSSNDDLAKYLDVLDMNIDQLSTKKNETLSLIRDLSDAKAKSVDMPDKEKVTFFRDGEREEWWVPKDIGSVLKRLDVDQGGWVMNSVAKVNQMFKSNVTTYSPTFLIKNAVRDPQNAAMIAKYGVLPKDLALAYSDIWNSRVGGSLFYKTWRELGGPLAGIFDDNATPDQLFNRLDKQLRRNIKEGKKNGSTVGNRLIESPNPLHILEGVNRMAEESTRLAVFIRALDEGAHPLDAVLESRDASVDFSKMGSLMRTLNKLVPFLNARVQGTTNFVKRFVKDPEAMIRRNALTTLPVAMTLHSHNAQFESYQNIDQKTKDTYWIYITGEMDAVDGRGNNYKMPIYVKFPKGEVQQLFANTFEQIGDIVKDKDPRTWQEFAGDMKGSMTPIQYSGFGPISTLPQLHRNYDDFFERPIEADFIRGKAREDWKREDRYDERTSSLAKKLGQGWPGEMLNLSPMQFDFMINSWAGNNGRDVNKAIDLITKDPTLRSVEPTKWEGVTKIPVVQAFISSSSFPQNRELKRVETANNQAKAKREEYVDNKLQPYIEKADAAGLLNALMNDDTYMNFNPIEKERLFNRAKSQFVKQVIDKNPDQTILSRVSVDDLYVYNLDRIETVAESQDFAGFVDLLRELAQKGVSESNLRGLAEMSIPLFGGLPVASPDAPIEEEPGPGVIPGETDQTFE